MHFKGTKFTANWNPADCHIWTTETVTNVLRQCRAYHNQINEGYAGPYLKLEDARKKEDAETQYSLIVVLIWIALLGGCIAALLYFINIEAILFFKVLAVFGILMFIYPAIRCLIGYLKRDAHRRKADELQKEIDELNADLNVFLQDNYDLNMKMRQLLPNYFSNYSAVNYMATCAENHRATTLAQCINLWEQEKHNLQVREIQSATLDATIAAQQAAARAASAADSAAQTANNIYRYK